MPFWGMGLLTLWAPCQELLTGTATMAPLCPCKGLLGHRPVGRQGHLRLADGTLLAGRDAAPPLTHIGPVPYPFSPDQGRGVPDFLGWEGQAGFNAASPLRAVPLPPLAMPLGTGFPMSLEA
jgi:hypothetical protein